MASNVKKQAQEASASVSKLGGDEPTVFSNARRLTETLAPYFSILGTLNLAQPLRNRFNQVLDNTNAYVPMRASIARPTSLDAATYRQSLLAMQGLDPLQRAIAQRRIDAITGNTARQLAQASGGQAAALGTGAMRAQQAANDAQVGLLASQSAAAQNAQQGLNQLALADQNVAAQEAAMYNQAASSINAMNEDRRKQALAGVSSLFGLDTVALNKALQNLSPLLRYAGSQDSKASKAKSGMMNVPVAQDNSNVRASVPVVATSGVDFYPELKPRPLGFLKR